jgi:cell division protein FtsI/penicillin-binding protein 2
VRNAIAAVFAALIVIAIAVAGWQLVEDRVSTEDARPEATIDVLVEALARGTDANLAAAVRSGGDVLDGAVALFDRALDGPSWRTERGPVTMVDDARAQATVTITLASEVFDTITWDTTVEATRIRGVWGIDAGSSTLHPELRTGHSVVVMREEVNRAPILAHDGEALTSHGSAWNIGIAPAQVFNEERLLQTWETVLPRSLGDLQALLERDDLNPTWFYPVVTVSQEQYETAWRRLRAVPGVIARDARDASPTDSDFATHVIGRVGRPTAEQAAQLGVPGTAIVGLRGLEREFETQLVGSEIARLAIVRPNGTEVTELARVQDDPSSPLHTTLDRTVQQALENALTGVSTPTGVVIVDTDTAAIRAAASRPLSGYHRAFEGNYPPGDAFLPVIAEVLLASGVSLDDEVACPAEAAVVGARLAAPADLGDTTVEAALAAGCDTSLGTLASRLEAAAFMAGAERFGFGVEPILPLPAATPSLPEPVDTTELVRAAVGQARVQASVLHVASTVGAAVSGTWHAPYLLADDADDRVAADLSPGTTDGIRRLLALGAEPDGSAPMFGPLGAVGVAGTAPVTGASTVHAWAIGVIDDLAFAVLVEDTGGDVAPATRVAERFLRELASLRRD